METICRTCMRPLKDRTFSLFQENGLINMIETIASVQLIHNKHLPSRICSECHQNINTFFNYRKVIITSQTDLNERLQIVLKTGSYYPRVKPKPNKNISISDDEMPLINYLKTDMKESSDDSFIKNENQSDEDDNDNADNDSDKDCLNDVQTPTSKLDKNVQRALYTKKLWKCKDCNEMFNSRRMLGNHRRTQHTAPAVCSICGTTVRADNLRKHIKIHTEDKKECDICGKTFKNTESLRGHKLIHRDSFFTCEICGKQFKLKSEHSRHLKLHLDPDCRKQQCTLCGKKVAELRKHMLTHTGEKPYICQFCNKGFCSTYSLKVHTRQHTNEKPYICQYCSLGFPQKVSLMTHLKSRHLHGV